ncbi:MAG: FecR domain-containing protein [Cytophagales bacterium]|nr:FecR domain-containing protein [Cytophagales bacterium]
MHTDKQIELIGKKLSGSLTNSEQDTFRELMEKPEFGKLCRKYEKIWTGSREQYRVLNSQSVLSRIKREIQTESGQYRSRYRSDYQYLGRIAASIVFLLAVAFTIFWYISDPSSKPVEQVLSRQVVKENPRGQKSTVFLPDGSKVILNSESRIEYLSVFEGESRTVRLSGEAFFEVERNEKLPFIVKTDVMDIRVLGTSFNVVALDRKKYKVSLARGQVEVLENVQNDGSIDKVMLFPGQAISYDPAALSFTEITKFNPEADFGWKNGLIYFENASFEEVMNRLGSWYGVEFTIIGTPDKEWHYSGKFDNYALDNVLYALSFTGKFRYELEGKKVQINF